MGIPALTLGLQAGSSILGGMAESAAAKGEKRHAEINAYIGRTRAIQTATEASEGLESELATMRAILAANNQRAGASTIELFNELRRVRGRERRIEYGNRMQEAADWRLAARNADARASGASFGSFIKAGPSLFDLYDLKTS
jgi:hypothetical protein